MDPEEPKMTPRWFQLAQGAQDELQKDSRWPQDGPKMAQNAHDEPQKHPILPQDGPKMALIKIAQESAQIAPRWRQDGPKNDTCRGPFWDPFQDHF